VWGYGQKDAIGYTWPGRTIHAICHVPLRVKWTNELGTDYLLTGLYTGRSVVDTSIHWAYSLPGYEHYSIEKNGVPVVVSETCLGRHGLSNVPSSHAPPAIFLVASFRYIFMVETAIPNLMATRNTSSRQGLRSLDPVGPGRSTITPIRNVRQLFGSLMNDTPRMTFHYLVSFSRTL
jgi:hypothetical protein